MLGSILRSYLGKLPCLLAFYLRLRCAADHGHQVVLELLVHVRADPNVAADTGAYGVGFTQVGAYPLHLAAKRGRIAVMEVLLKAGAALGHLQWIRATLLEAVPVQVPALTPPTKMAADRSTHYGYTALHYAALVPRPEVVYALLEGRATSNVVDREGRCDLHQLRSVRPCVPPRFPRIPTLSHMPGLGIGDEYCYENDISHGYRRKEQEVSWTHWAHLLALDCV
ncbi:ANK2 [Symbiodinium pilosum]|uniref:ANK2 protein n=1 Tax=Symbiodinium pilosum TaxID=2952 RepID=A0A812VNI3_SYMPI|nr:ANK2 [Symbiodinium pilosum]